MNKIIALVGMCGSGKSVVNDYFKERGYFSVYFGGITMDELQKRNLETNPGNEKMVREELRKTHGPAAYAILNLPKIEAALQDGNVIIDGLYSWSEYKILKEKFGETLKIIAVFAAPGTRYERLSHRDIRPISPQDAQKRDYAEIENIEKGGPIAMADYTLVNDDTIDRLLAQLKSAGW
jgi:dephospho-CoA kinase